MAAIKTIFKNLISFLFQVGMLLSAILLIVLGLKYAVSKGEKKTEELKKFLIYVIVGLILLIISFFVPTILKDFLQKFTESTT